jgi:hypothetical protein
LVLLVSDIFPYRYALFLDEDDNENDENQLLEQFSTKGGKNVTATSTGKAAAASATQSKGVKNQSAAVSTDVRVKSAGGSAAANSKKVPAPSGTAGAKSAATTSGGASKDNQAASGAGAAKFGRPRVSNDQNADRAYRDEDRGNQSKFNSGYSKCGKYRITQFKTACQVRPAYL